ncbi:MAG: flagellar hook-associated protein FlgK [Pseudoxanthomonas sp.]
MSVMSTGTSALIAFQRALTTVGHNVANVNTAGYSRQSTEFATANATFKGFGYVGNGTQITDVRRVADQLATTRLLDSSGEMARLGQLSSLSSRVDTLFSDSATGLSGAWSDFFDSVSGLSSNAASAASRADVLAQANSLVTRFKQLDGQLDGIDSELNSKLIGGADEINRLSAQIAKLNGQIGTSSATASSDLLDTRDQLIKQLVSYTGGTAVSQDGGAMNVYTSGGQALVVGATASTVTTVADAYQPERLQLAIKTSTGTVRLDKNAMGGQMGGIMEFRSTVLDPALAELGRIATGLAVSFNDAHAAGVDLYGQLGTDLFTLTAPRITGNTANTGSASLSASVTDLSKLDGQNVVLGFNGTTWSASNASTGASIAMTGTGTTADPYMVNGVAVTIGAGANTGDKFLLQPTAGVAGGMSVAISDPSRLAAATPVGVSADLGNLGTGAPGKVTITDAGNPALRTAASIEFIDGTQYTVDGDGPFTYTAGQTISANGWSVVLDGAPVAGDTFQISATPAGSSNNGNAAFLGNLDDAKKFNGGTISLNGAIGGLTTSIGSAARQAKYSADAQTALNNEAQAARDSISGVNLDEEAANMLKLQQAYQAAAQIISTADSMFQSILSAVRS